MCDMKNNKELDRLSKLILDASIEVHKEIGPGLLESVYQLCLPIELENKGIKSATSVKFPLIYEGVLLDEDIIVDLLVEDEIIIQVKSVDQILPFHNAQLTSYLKATNKKLGFLINFNVATLEEGFRRVHNN
jgi:GxxExxY protein